MRPLAALSIRRKLRRVGLLASTTALLSAIAAFVVYDVTTFRSEMVRRLGTQADIVGYNSASALLFNDPESAATTLASLKADPHVMAAGIYDAQGRPFATYVRADGSGFTLPPLVPRSVQEHEFDARELRLFEPVSFDGRSIGTVYIQSDLAALGARMRRYGLILLLVFVGSSALAVLISGRVQAGISRPILALADTARVVSRDRDYSLRAEGAGQDEVGQLVSTFNDMLAQIQQRDRELQEARETLEERVAERTLALSKSQELLSAAQRLAQMGSWEWDVDRNLIFWSDELYRIYGFLPGSFVPAYENFLQSVHPLDRERVEAAVRSAVRTGDPFTFEHRIVRPDGEERVVESSGTVTRDAAGRVVRLLGTAQDVTARRAAEAEREQLIREQAARAESQAGERRSAFLAEVSASLGASLEYEKTLATLARLVVPRIADWCLIHIAIDGTIRPVAVAHVDPAKEPLARELAGRRTQGGGTPGGVEEVLRTGKAVLHTTLPRGPGGQDEELARIVTQLGFASGMMVPLRTANQVLGTIALGSARRPYGPVDVSLAQAVADRAAIAVENARLYQEAREANRLKDEFLATLSHELRTPLNAIVGWAGLLRGGKLDAPTRDRAVETIERNARAQTQLIEDILDVSRIVAGKLRLDVVPVDLGAIVAASEEAVRPAADAKRIRLDTRVPADPVVVKGDANRLQQIVWNLLSNAIKFTPREGAVRVTVEGDDTQGVVSVHDNGMGIRAAFLPHVFERFRQGDSSSTRPHGGLGLGLAIVRHLVELHGGTVEVASEGEDKGSTFTVRLPRENVPRPAAADVLRAPAATAPSPLDDLTGLHVLVVDDEPDTRELLSMVLGQHGARVETASSADEAMRAIDRQAPDVLLSDIEMPGGDGYSLLARVRALPPEKGGKMPAAALTAYARAEDRLAALRAGFQLHVAKPIQPSEVAAVVRSLVTRS
jgi:PAS domain S-box-containing protein